MRCKEIVSYPLALGREEALGLERVELGERREASGAADAVDDDLIAGASHAKVREELESAPAFNRWTRAFVHCQGGHAVP